jgi:hypothetical protein
VPAEATEVRCAYCGTPLAIEHKRPPKDPTLTQPRTVYVAPPRPLGARLAFFIGPLITASVLGTQFWPQLRTMVPVIGNALPTECPINGKVSISGKTFQGTGTLIRAATNCTVTIKDSTLEGDVIVEGDTNVAVEIVHSKLTAKKRAIVTGLNPKVRITSQSELRGEKAALDLGLNAEVRLEDSRITSPGVALRAEHNLRLDNDGGKIEGRVEKR